MTLPSATVAVAFSGGRDSLALLHATVHAASLAGLQVVALHVHHGLMPQADAWLASASALCARWRRRGLPVRLRWHRVVARPAQGDSVEAWARAQRYAALTRMAKEEGATLVLLAQHRRDQAETVLLQALRGAGPKGLAAMPDRIERDGLVWVRPWLRQRREAIDAYVRRHRLRPVEDPSNLDERLARNRFRLQVWPALQSAFAEAESSLCAVARRAQEATTVLEEVAASDLRNAVRDGALAWHALSGLSAARRVNAVRHWLGLVLGSAPPNALVQRVVEEVKPGAANSWPIDGARVVRLYRGQLCVEPIRATLVGSSQTLDLSRPGRVEVLDWGGHFDVAPAIGPVGLPATAAARATLRARTGGERFQRHPGGLPRSLKKEFQVAEIPPSHRGGPLVWLDGRLAFVPGLGIDARWRGADGEPRVTLRWLQAEG